MTSIDMVMLAKRVATVAHAGQLDKAGLDYISHPARVASRVHSLEARVLAWLHDVVEDTEMTLDDLARAGFPESIVLQVDALTHRPHESRDEYYARVLAWPAATVVKLEDVADNSSEARLRYLDEKTQIRLRRKYAHARSVLMAG